MPPIVILFWIVLLLVLGWDALVWVWNNPWWTLLICLGLMVFSVPVVMLIQGLWERIKDGLGQTGGKK